MKDKRPDVTFAVGFFLKKNMMAAHFKGQKIRKFYSFYHFWAVNNLIIKK